MNKMKHIITIMAATLTGIFLMASMALPQNCGNHPELSYEPSVDFLHLPAGANFEEVAGVALNSKGHLFVFHRGEHPLMEFDVDGKFLRSIGDGIIDEAHGLRIDPQDNIWITDVATHLVVKFSPEGRVLLVLGQKNKAGEWHQKYDIVLFDQPTDVGFGLGGDFFVSDGYGNSRIVKFDKDGRFIKTWGKAGAGEGEFNIPHSLAVDADGLLYVADRENSRIQIFDQDGNFIKMWTHIGKPYGLFITPEQVLFTTDGIAGCVFRLDLSGKILGSLGTPGKSRGEMGLPHFLTVGKNETIYVAEILNWRVQRFVH